MTHVFLRAFGVPFVMAALLAGAGCAGTNTGNGSPVEGPSCPVPQACAEPATLTGSDGRTYRGRITSDVTIASDSNSASLAVFTFAGDEVDLSGGECHETEQNTYGVQIFLSAADTSIDPSGTLHTHSAPRNGYYASSPSEYANSSSTPGWAVDLALTSDGDLTATLSLSAANGGCAYNGNGGTSGTCSGGTGGTSNTSDGGGAGGAASLDAGDPMQTITLSGPIDSNCGASISVSSGGIFKLPCRQSVGCSGP